MTFAEALNRPPANIYLDYLMIFSLQRRFIVLLLVPVILILVVTGVAGFFFARKFLVDAVV